MYQNVLKTMGFVKFGSLWDLAETPKLEIPRLLKFWDLNFRFLRKSLKRQENKAFYQKWKPVRAMNGKREEPV